MPASTTSRPSPRCMSGSARATACSCMLSAGNLAFTQSVVSLLNEKIDLGRGGRAPIARHRDHDVPGGAHRRRDGARSAAQREGADRGRSRPVQRHLHPRRPDRTASAPRLFQIYQEGNFIEATKDTAYFQIGEHKYGKPILDRVAKPDMRMGVAAKLLLISFDSTLRSNLSVGMPIDLLIYRRDTLEIGEQRRIEETRSVFPKDLRRLVAGDPRRLRPYRRIWRGRREGDRAGRGHRRQVGAAEGGEPGDRRLAQPRRLSSIQEIVNSTYRRPAS